MAQHRDNKADELLGEPQDISTVTTDLNFFWHETSRRLAEEKIQPNLHKLWNK